MTQEELDFIYFKKNQLYNVCFNTGSIDVKVKTRWKNVHKYYYNIGSLNHDNYERVWTNKKLRMKHRLIYWLYHGTLPEEIDHINKIRNDNSIHNLRSVTRKENVQNNNCSSFKRLSFDEVHELCKAIQSNLYNITQLSKMFNKSRVHIKNIMGKKHWSEISNQYF